MCRRASDRVNCVDCGKIATTKCTFALGGKKTGSVCGRACCRTCAPNNICPPHRRLIEKKAASPAFPRI
jgi:hypothetical protein